MEKKLELLTGFRGYIYSRLDKEDGTLELDRKSQSRLLNLLSEEGSYGHLVVTDDRCYEIIKVSRACDTILVERGLDGTDPSNFPCGALVAGELVPSDIRYMICNEDCVDCGCKPVKYSGSVLPPLEEGKNWEGRVVFEGDTPMSLGVSGAPSWMKVVTGQNYVRLSGVPSTTDKFSISVAATNCAGKLDNKVLQVE